MNSREWGLLAYENVAVTLIFLICIIAACWISAKLRRTRAAALGTTSSAWSFVATEIPVLLAAVLCSIIPLRPYYGKEELPHQVPTAELIILFDVSSSMLANDLNPNRLVHARRTIERTLDMAQTRSATKVGIVLFAGTSYLYCPLTPDLEAVRLFLDGVATTLISAPGSALTDALDTATKAFSKDAQAQKTLLVVTDGEEQEFDLNRASSLIKESGATLIVYAVGTSRGSPIRTEEGRFLKGPDGQIVISSLNEVGLKRLTSQLGGQLVLASRASSDAKSLVTALPNGGSQLQTPDSSGKSFRFKELGPLLASLALLLLLFAAFLSKEPLLLTLVVLAAVPSNASAQTSRLAEGYDAYQKEDFSTARTIFEEAHKEAPQNAKITRALANSLYRLGEFQQAEKLFAEAHKQADSEAESFMSSYNRGNAAFEQQDFRAAKKAYEDALQIRPQDSAALHNLKLAEKRLMEQQQSSSSDSREKQDNQSESSSDQQQQSSKDSDPGERKDKANSERDESSKGEETETGQQDQEDSRSPEDGKDQTEQGTKGSESEQQQKETDRGEKGETQQFKELNDKDAKTGKPAAAKEAEVSDEAIEAWLSTLPDQPIVRRQGERGRIPPGGQTW